MNVTDDVTTSAGKHFGGESCEILAPSSGKYPTVLTAFFVAIGVGAWAIKASRSACVSARESCRSISRKKSLPKSSMSPVDRNRLLS